jgi:beta-galactosidase
MKKILLGLLILSAIANLITAQDKHKFEFAGKEFMLDGKPFQIIGGELHPGRIPHEYWRHRIRMVKAMGCNTISVYLFWNYHELSPGQFDFQTENRNIAEFIKIVKEEGMWMLMRPGPYSCGEWDFGGLPGYLLKDPATKIRCLDPEYIKVVKRYMDALAAIIKAGLCSQGGPIIMVQIENEYGCYGNDRNYMRFLKDYWVKKGIDVPFFTADEPTLNILEAGTLDSCAIGLNSGSSLDDFAIALKMNPNVPSFSSETYPGWLTHWGEKLAQVKTGHIVKEVRFLMDNKKSFVLYMIHGGTNFGFTAGANSGIKGYQPDITSYDYDAPISEQGLPTPKFDSLRALISEYKGSLPPVPPPVTCINIPDIKMQVFSSVWNHLPVPEKLVQPKPMESLGQYTGFILYRTKVIGYKSSTLKVTDLHDYGLVYLDSKFVVSMDRRLAENSAQLPVSSSNTPQLDIFVEAMGHTNYAEEMIDRKGITERVSLNGTTLMNWDVFNLPFDGKYIQGLKASAVDTEKRLIFFKGSFNLNKTGDCWFDLSGYQKGIVFINGHNLGRYWNIGPQKRLYCPASWLKAGTNEIIIFDLLQTQAKELSAYAYVKEGF